MSFPIRRVLLYALAAAAAGALGYRALRPAAVVVETAAVSQGPLEVTLEEEGRTRIRPRHVIAAPVAGRLLPLALVEGETVARGRVVARLAPLPLDVRGRQAAEARLAAARAAAREARAGVGESEALAAQAASSAARKRRLAADGVVAAEELELAATAERTADESVARARERAAQTEFAAEAARSELIDAERGATLELRSPVDGEVLRRFEESERVLAAGEPILEIGDRRSLEIAVEVLTTDAVLIAPGMPMRVDAGLAAPLPGRVAYVEPAAFTKVSPLGVEEQRVLAIGRLDEEAPALGDRFRIRAAIVVWSAERALRVPTATLFRSAGGAERWAVFLLEDGRARRAEVTIGRRGARDAELLSGLEDGDEVVLYPNERIAEGVRLVREPTAR